MWKFHDFNRRTMFKGISNNPLPSQRFSILILLNKSIFFSLSLSWSPTSIYSVLNDIIKYFSFLPVVIMLRNPLKSNYLQFPLKNTFVRLLSLTPSGVRSEVPAVWMSGKVICCECNSVRWKIESFPCSKKSHQNALRT